MELSPITDGMTTQNESGAEAGAAAGEPGAGAPPQGLQLDKTQVGAAISKLISASIGDLVVVMSKSPAHKHYSLADIEWMVLPPVLAGQFYVAEATNAETGFRAPIAAVTWARASAEVDARLREGAGRPIRLRPDEWTSGDTFWLIDIVGDPRGLGNALHWLLDEPFKDRPAYVVVRDAAGGAKLETVQALASAALAASGGMP
jgi:hemolysin-activating ACP:hemolysin acyltransferase